MDSLQETSLVSYIYGLSSSKNIDNIRYIGYSFNPIKRLSAHIAESKNLKYRRHKWINEQITLGYTIILTVLRCVNEDLVGKSETETILFYKAIGADLINGNLGGIGGKSPSKEVREKLSKSKIGNTWNKGKTPSNLHILEKFRGLPKTEEVKIKMSEVRLGKRTLNRKVTDELVINIFNLYNSGHSMKQIMEKLNITKSTFSNILYSKNYYLDVKKKHNLNITITGKNKTK